MAAERLLMLVDELLGPRRSRPVSVTRADSPSSAVATTAGVPRETLRRWPMTGQEPDFAGPAHILQLGRSVNVSLQDVIGPFGQGAED